MELVGRCGGVSALIDVCELRALGIGDARNGLGGILLDKLDRMEWWEQGQLEARPTST